MGGRGEEGRWKKRGDGGREREEGRDRSERLTLLFILAVNIQN